MALFSARTLNFFGALACLLLLGAGFYLEHLGVLPCSLCILQRLVFLVLGVVCLIAALHNPGATGVRIYGVMVLLLAILGVFLAGRQVWLQGLVHAPAEVCLPGLSYMLTHFPWIKAAELMLQGADDCGRVTWRLLGWSIARWALLWFVLFALLGVWQVWRGKVREV